MTADFRADDMTRLNNILPRAVYTARRADRRGWAPVAMPQRPATNLLLNI